MQALQALHEHKGGRSGLARQMVQRTLRHIRTAGYTQFNAAGVLLWYATACPAALGSILWCNSCSIAFSYEMTRLVDNAALQSLKRCIPPYSDVVLHAAPFVLLRHVPPAQLVHALLSIAAHATWGAAHGFDLNRIYRLKSPLSSTAMRVLWLCALLGHLAPLASCHPPRDAT